MCFYILVLCYRYKAVFGPKLEQQPTNLGDQNGALTISEGLEIDKKLYGDGYKCSSVQVIFSAFKFIHEKTSD